MKTAAVCLLVALLVQLKCIQGASVTGSPTTPAADRPGTCPPPVPMILGACFKVCSTDQECEGNRKCCKTACNGFQCQIPDNKPGACPENVSSTTCDTTVHCASDSKCDGDQKCCSTGCNGSICQSPIDV